MREKFLMDLDDALHARDARQILKLIKQYELDKLQAERDYALKQEAAKKDESKPIEILLRYDISFAQVAVNRTSHTDLLTFSVSQFVVHPRGYT